MNSLLERFRKEGYHADSFGFGLKTLFPLEIMRRAFISKMQKIRAQHPDLERVYLVPHSMGGVVASDLLEHMVFEGLEVRLVTLGTPFQGTWSALIGSFWSIGAIELLPILRQYKAAVDALPRIKVPFLSISGDGDYISPPETCSHPDAINVVVSTDHAGLLVEDEVFPLIVRFLNSTDPHAFKP